MISSTLYYGFYLSVIQVLDENEWLRIKQSDCKWMNV